MKSQVGAKFAMIKVAKGGRAGLWCWRRSRVGAPRGSWRINGDGRVIGGSGGRA
jgi:hypothetical protein